MVNITWKATYLVTRENVQVHIPNSRIDASIYYNFNRPVPEVLTKLSLGVEYGASPERVRNAIMEVLGRVLLERRAALNRKAIPDANGESVGLIRRIRSFFHL